MYYLANGSTDSKIIYDLFADYFKSVYTVNPVLHRSSFQLYQVLGISNVDLSLADMENALSCLDCKFSFDSAGVAHTYIFGTNTRNRARPRTFF